MSGTLNSQAIRIANNIVSISQQMMVLYQQIVALDAAWTDTGAATILAAMATTAVNADGSTGAADGAPNTAHPISNVALSQALSSTQFTQAKTILDAIRSLIEGNAVTAQGGARAILNVTING